MDSEKLNNWMQVVGIFALVGSLIFVGLQMRQEHEIARVMIYQERASSVAEVLTATAASPYAMAAAVKSASGDPNQEILIDGFAGPITAQDMWLGTYQASALLTLADNSYFQYQEGFLPLDHWMSVRSMVKAVAVNQPFFRFRIEQSLDQQRPEFREELTSIIGEIDQSEPTNRP
ncbi:MAG: hypothetical protein MUP90_14415 [Gammaproteobacteria bacterium]|nr:hypothetical protein [Gammaproteobacteria bacterium]